MKNKLKILRPRTIINKGKEEDPGGMCRSNQPFSAMFLVVNLYQFFNRSTKFKVFLRENCTTIPKGLIYRHVFFPGLKVFEFNQHSAYFKTASLQPKFSGPAPAGGIKEFSLGT